MNITTLSFDEKVRLDSDRLAELYVQLGEAGAQDVVCRAMEELAVRMANINESYLGYKTGELRKGAKGLIGIAEQIGMQRLADVARAVCFCAAENDPVALGATIARLLRIGDSSLTAVWDLQDLSV
ncbi:hypothetical protein [Profundibacter sp.]